MIDYNNFINGQIDIPKPRNHYEDLSEALTISLDPVLGLILFSNVFTAYKMDKNDNNKYYWLIGSNLLNIYLFNLMTVRVDI